MILIRLAEDLQVRVENGGWPDPVSILTGVTALRGDYRRGDPSSEQSASGHFACTCGVLQEEIYMPRMLASPKGARLCIQQIHE